MPALAVICSGQGKQSHDMFDGLLSDPEASALYERLSPLLSPQVDLRDPNADIFRNDIAQPALCLYQMMVWELVRKNIPEVEIFAGYSLGELSAYACAGVWDPEELIRLAGIRGRLMSAAVGASPQSMAAVIGLRRSQVEALCAEYSAAVAIVNASDHFICGMLLEQIPDFCASALREGASKAQGLPVTVASHTFYMDEVADAFRSELDKSTVRAGFDRVIAGVSGEKVFGRKQMTDALCAQIHRSIDWRGCMESAYSYGCRIFLELGPGSALTRMLLDKYPDVQARSVSDFHDPRAISKWIEAVSRRLNS